MRGRPEATEEFYRATCGSKRFCVSIFKRVDCKLSGIIITSYNLIVVTAYRSALGNLNTCLDVLQKFLLKLNCNALNEPLC